MEFSVIESITTDDERYLRIKGKKKISKSNHY